MLMDYMNQSSTWKHITGVDDYNQATYSAQVIKCRKEDSTKLVRNKNGVQVVSSSTYYCLSPVQVDDLLDGKAVITVNSLVGLDGNREGYEVMVE